MVMYIHVKSALLASAVRLGELTARVAHSFPSTTRIPQWAKERIATMPRIIAGRAILSVLVAFAWVGVTWIGSPIPVMAEVLTLTNALKDATLFESSTGTLAAGGEDGLFVGRTAQGAGTSLRRGLIEFDLSQIPDGAIINSVELRLLTTMDPPAGPATTPVSLHRVLGDWGEGNVNPGGVGGAGGAAQTGDATWRHQFFPSDPWTNVGGDFTAQASASATVGSQGTFATWLSTAALVADVQAWADNDATNFGWLLRGNEAVSQSARKFASSEFSTTTSRPRLTIDYTVPSTRTPGDINGDGFVDRVDVALLSANFGTTTTPNNFDLGEFSGDGIVGIADLAVLQRNFSPLAAPSATAVPEPGSLITGAIGVVLCSVAAMRRRRYA
jgi:hypothetical protein